MKLVAIALAGLAGLSVAVERSRAADMTAPLAAPVVAPVYNWTGFYVGAHAGYGWGRESIHLSPGTPLLGPFFAAGVYPRSIASNPDGFIGGIQWGSNWQFNRVVLGLESDFSWANIKSSEAVRTSILGGILVTRTVGEQELEWFGTTRLRAGFLATDHFLIYATGGLANGRVQTTVSHASTLLGVSCPPGIVPCVEASQSNWKWGWTVGGGIEYAWGRWSAKIEYLHYALGDQTFQYIDRRIRPAVFTASTEYTGDMVRFGVNYRFDWTPWQLLFGR
jgi:outer membrane immunogenic protein